MDNAEAIELQGYHRACTKMLNERMKNQVQKFHSN